MHHLHIFVVLPSACGPFCGGISSENQCCHGWMYVAPTSARVRSPAHSSHMSPIYMSPADRGFPASSSIFGNLKYTNTACPSRVGWFAILLCGHSASLSPSTAQGLTVCLFMKAYAEIKQNLTRL